MCRLFEVYRTRWKNKSKRNEYFCSSVFVSMRSRLSAYFYIHCVVCECVSVCMTFANEFWATYYSFGMPQNHQYRTWNVFFLTVSSFPSNSLAYSFNRTLCVSPSLFSSCFFHFILWNVQSLYIFFCARDSRNVATHIAFGR